MMKSILINIYGPFRDFQRVFTVHPGSKGKMVKKPVFIGQVYVFASLAADLGYSLMRVAGNEIFYKVRFLAQQFAAFNPHATFVLREGDKVERIEGSRANWQKWRPSDPTSAHWYSVERLCGLIAAYVAEEKNGGRVRTVREFVSEFRGLSATAKQKAVTEEAHLSGKYLYELVKDGDISLDIVSTLLEAMRRNSTAVNPKALGVVGEEHLTEWLERNFVERESIRYRKVEGVANSLPFVLEVAFGWHVKECFEDRGNQVFGLNWSPLFKPPFHELPVLLGEARVDSFDPVVVVVHLACPRLEFTDRGKSSLTLPREMLDAFKVAIKSTTKHWTALKRQADREDQVRARELEHWRKMKQKTQLSVKEAAYKVMQAAYLKASAGGQLPANARQIMYAARPLVLELTNGKLWKDSAYFTQILLPDFVEENPGTTAGWDVVFDARGHLLEPHTGERIGLGTLDVRYYVEQWSEDSSEQIELDLYYPTHGPENRYRHVLFVEKEGFDELFKAVQIAERFDVAIMSTKGMSVTAARQLVERLTIQGVKILVIRDFDKAGFSIVHTLCSDTRRYRFRRRPDVADLGLRLTDVEEMALQSEPVEYPSKVDPRVNLKNCGATESECNFLVQGKDWHSWKGQRVELNAMTSDQFIAWLERKFREVGVQKVVPEQAVLEKAYRRAWRLLKVQEAIDSAMQVQDTDIPVPDELERYIREATEPTQSWDLTVWELARDAEQGVGRAT